MTDAVRLHPRKPLTDLQRAKLFDEYGGICWICDYKIMIGERWRDEHKIPLAMGGTNEWSNRAPVHDFCAKGKDAIDIPAIAKAKRIRARHIGANKPKHKWPKRKFGRG